MNRRSLAVARVVAVALVFGAWTLAGCGGHEQPPSGPPVQMESRATVEGMQAGAESANLIIVLIDAARADHFGAFGYERDTTPNADRLFARSVVFGEAYAQAPNTKASIASLFTSQFPDTHGVIGMHVAVPSDVPTLAELLNQSGFHTAAFSANPFLSSDFGFARGFDEFYEVFREVGLVPNRLGCVPADLMVEKAVPWFREHSKQRFFAYLHFLEPHKPYAPPPPFNTRYGGNSEIARLTALYDGNLAYVDDAVGRLLKEIQDMGLFENSVVVFLADHGEALGEHGHFGHVECVYEPTIRIPLSFRFPESCGPPAGRRSEIISITDLMPTLLDLFGIRAPDTVQGSSRLAAIGGEEGLKGRYAVSRSRGTDTTGGARNAREVIYAVTARHHTLIVGDLGNRIELYDREADPEQLNNIAEERADLVAELQGRFEEWAEGQRGRPVVLPGGKAFVSHAPRVEMGEQMRKQLEALGYLE